MQELTATAVRAPIAHSAHQCPSAVGLPAHSACRAHALTPDIDALLDHAAGLAARIGEGGNYPAAKQLNLVIKSVYSSQVVNGAVVFSTRGGDFIITVGGDFTVGYRSHDETAIHLFCVETIAAQLLTPEAICVIS